MKKKANITIYREIMEQIEAYEAGILKDGEIKEDKVSFFVHLYRKAVLKRNKMNYPGSNVSLMYAVRRNHKSCGCCTRFKHEDAYGNGWCSKLNVAKECGDWCEGKFFIKKKKLRLI